MKLGQLWRRFVRGQPVPFSRGMTPQERGALGEAWGAWYYQRRGAEVLARNWRGGGGELDLVLREGDVLVIAEVKTRGPRDPDPLAMVRDPRRMAHQRRAAMAFRRRLRPPHPDVRYDALVVRPPRGGVGDPTFHLETDYMKSEPED